MTLRSQEYSWQQQRSHNSGYLIWIAQSEMKKSMLVKCAKQKEVPLLPRFWWSSRD